MSELLSVVIPAYNEEAMVEAAAEAVSRVLTGAGVEYELIFVDDGSRDSTWRRIEALAGADSRVRGISFSRNFGKDRAVFAGLSRAAGGAVAVMDCDLQHPPELLTDMLSLWREGYEVVEGVKTARGRESIFHRAAAGIFNAVMSAGAGVDMRRASDFMLLDRRVVEALLSLPEEEVFFRGLVSFVGFRRREIGFSVAERQAGESKWSFRSLSKYAVSSITSFSTAPLMAAVYLGVLMGIAAVVLTLGLVFSEASRGWVTASLAALLFAAALILLCLGVAGYYIARIYRRSLGRPRFIIARECGKK